MKRIIRWFNINATFKKRRAGFYVDLAHAIRNADSLRRFLEAGQAHLIKYNDPGQAEIYGEMLENLNQSNGSLRGMMGDLVPTTDLLTLTAIDRGRTDVEKSDGLRWLAQNIGTLKELKTMVIKSVSVLGFVVPVVAATLATISIKFIPLFEKNLSHEHWSSLGQSLYWVSYATTHWFFIIVPVAIFLSVAFARSFGRWTGNSRRVFERKFRVLRLPYLLHRDYVCANFFVSLAGLLKTKVSLKGALESLYDAANPYLKWHIEEILFNLKENPTSITEAFDTGLLAPDLHLRLANYSATKGGFETGLIDLATNGMEHVKEEVEKSSKYLNFLSIVFVVLSVAYLYFGNMEIAYGIKNYQESNLQSKKF